MPIPAAIHGISIGMMNNSASIKLAASRHATRNMYSAYIGQCCWNCQHRVKRDVLAGEFIGQNRRHRRARADLKHEEHHVVKNEQQPGDSFDNRISRRNRLLAVSTLPAQARSSRTRECCRTTRASYCTWDNAKAVKQAIHSAASTPDDDIQKTANAGAECEDEEDEDDVGSEHWK